jgi:hypothetical protein
MGAFFSTPTPVGPIKFTMDQNVSFVKDNERIYGKVIGIECSKMKVSKSNPHDCNLNLSQILIEDLQTKNTHIVSPNDPTLQIENMTIEEAKEKYKIGIRVYFTQDSIKEKNFGIIDSYGINTTSDRISNTDYVQIHVQKGTNNNYWVNIPFTDPSLKLYPVPYNEANLYSIGSRVSLIWQGKVKTGIIVNNKVVKLDNENIDEIESFIEVKFDDNTTQKIKFTENELTLLEDINYRVKYMKYKAKYLLQKK